jgi:hypothetical protein
MQSNTTSIKLLKKLGLSYEKDFVADAGPLMLFSASALQYQQQ